MNTVRVFRCSLHEIKTFRVAEERTIFVICRYGKVFRSHLFGSPTVVSCDHELNAFILQNEEKLFQCSYPNSIHGILGESSMLVVVGEKHKTLRSLALALVLATKAKPEFLIDIERTAILVMESWKDKDEVVLSAEAKKVSTVTCPQQSTS